MKTDNQAQDQSARFEHVGCRYYNQGLRIELAGFRRSVSQAKLASSRMRALQCLRQTKRIIQSFEALTCALNLFDIGNNWVRFGAPRRRVSPAEEDSAQRVVD